MSDNIDILHLDDHPHALLDENDFVFNCVLFSTHDNDLINQTMIASGAKKIISCCEVGIAHIGGDLYNNKFYPPKPHNSWNRNEELVDWEAPVAYPEFDPENPIFYIWNEEILNWEEVSE